MQRVRRAHHHRTMLPPPVGTCRLLLWRRKPLSSDRCLSVVSAAWERTIPILLVPQVQDARRRCASPVPSCPPPPWRSAAPCCNPTPHYSVCWDALRTALAASAPRQVIMQLRLQVAARLPVGTPGVSSRGQEPAYHCSEPCCGGSIQLTGAPFAWRVLTRKRRRRAC